MRLVSYGPRRAEAPGVLLDDDTILPLAPLLAEVGVVGGDMNAVLGMLDALRPAIDRAIAADGPRVPRAGTRLGPPVPRPENVIVAGGNYLSHVREAAHVTGGDGQPPSLPLLVLKPSRSVIGPTDPLVRPRESQQLDYETELGVVIGRGGARIRREDAMEHVGGYMIVNDVTARDVAMGEVHVSPLFMQLTRGKGFPTFCPCGPFIATRDEIPDPHALRIRCWVNGELRQDDTTADMIVDVPGLVATCSDAMELTPGDIILTGTPAGCGGLMDPPRFLWAGDVVTMEIEGLGRMDTPIADEA